MSTEPHNRKHWDHEPVDSWQETHFEFPISAAILASEIISTSRCRLEFESLLTIHRLRTAAADVVATLANATENDLYRATLKVQEELNIGETVRYLIGQPKWSAAKSVLDLGCGPGDLLNHLAPYFPDKRFMGVDSNADFVAIARNQTQRLQNCSFCQGDAYTFADGRYDFVILKAVLQHLKEPNRFMKHLPELLDKEAVVLFIDTTRENFIVAEPPITAFNRLYAQLETIQKQHSGSRDCMDELLEQLDAYGFRLLEAHTPSVPVPTTENRLKAVRYLLLASATVKKMMPPLELELRDLTADLVAWHDAPDACMSIKSRRMLIERI